MEFRSHRVGGETVAELIGDTRIADVGQVLDLMGDAPSHIILLHKEALDPRFFDLTTGFAGEVMQKAANYHLKLGILGDHTAYESRSLRSLIKECNRQGRVVFAATVEEAAELLGLA